MGLNVKMSDIAGFIYDLQDKGVLQEFMNIHNWKLSEILGMAPEDADIILDCMSKLIGKSRIVDESTGAEKYYYVCHMIMIYHDYSSDHAFFDYEFNFRNHGMNKTDLRWVQTIKSHLCL